MIFVLKFRGHQTLILCSSYYILFLILLAEEQRGNLDFVLLSQSTEVSNISLHIMKVLGDPISFWEQRSATLTSCQSLPF